MAEQSIVVTDPVVASAVMTESKRHGVYPGEIPESDEQRVALANEMVRLADEALAMGMQGEAVSAVLSAAAQQNGGVAAVPTTAPPPLPAPAAPGLSEPVLPGLEGPYSKAKIPDIVEAIEGVVRDQGEAAKQTLAVVWEYETKNKNRKRLLDKLGEIAQNGVAAQAPQPAPAPAPIPDPPVPAAAPPAAAVAPAIPPEGDDVRPEPPFAQAPPPPPPAPAPVATVPPAPPAPVVPAAPDVSTPSFDEIVPPFEDKATTLAQRAVVKEHLPVPQDAFVEGQPPQIPADFTGLTTVEVAQYQSRFNACYARSYYLLAIAEGHAADAKIVGDGYVQKFMAETDWPKGTTVAQMEAKATQAPEVQHARRVAHEWSEYARQLRHLAAIYEKTCERLSREQTRRSDDVKTS